MLLLPGVAQQKSAVPAAAQPRPIPDEAVRQNKRLAVNLSPTAKKKVQSAAAALALAEKRQPKMTAAQVQASARALVGQAFPNLSGMDPDAVVFLVLMECAQDQQSELQQAMNAMQQNAAAKQGVRSAQSGAAQQTSDMNSEMQTELQLEMAQWSTLEEAMSNMMKSAADAQAAMIANLK
ncbi:MAG: hypothetical protein ABR910_00610 [Acidobacteriaceae bacterium]